MFLNQTSHYALRAITELLSTRNGEPINSAELSKKTNVPSHYLSKIMRKMVEAGYVQSKKGHGGGFTLITDPKELRIIDVLTVIGFDLDHQPCVFGWAKCSDSDPCPLHSVWKKLKESFKEWACNITFEDIRKDRKLIEETVITGFQSESSVKDC